MQRAAFLLKIPELAKAYRQIIADLRGELFVAGMMGAALIQGVRAVNTEQL
ncbi:hypothetical protein PA45B_3681 [Escherichia coli]|nr:hypothetical protein PA45B_3681 [Escherichia coli]